MSLYKKLSLLRATAGAAVNRIQYVISLFSCDVLTPEMIFDLKSTGADSVDVASTFFVVAYALSKNTLDLTIGNNEIRETKHVFLRKNHYIETSLHSY